MPVRRKEGLDPRDHNFLVLAPRGWGEADTLDQAIENAKVNMPEYEDGEVEKVEATVYLITSDTDAKIKNLTGAVALDEMRIQSYPVPDEEIETDYRDEGNGIEIRPVEDGEDEKLEYLTNIEIQTDSRPKPQVE